MAVREELQLDHGSLAAGPTAGPQRAGARQGETAVPEHHWWQELEPIGVVAAHGVGVYTGAGDLQRPDGARRRPAGRARVHGRQLDHEAAAGSEAGELSGRVRPGYRQATVERARYHLAAGFGAGDRGGPRLHG